MIHLWWHFKILKIHSQSYSPHHDHHHHRHWIVRIMSQYKTLSFFLCSTTNVLDLDPSSIFFCSFNLFPWTLVSSKLPASRIQTSSCLMILPPVYRYLEFCDLACFLLIKVINSQFLACLTRHLDALLRAVSIGSMWQNNQQWPRMEPVHGFCSVCILSAKICK